MNTSPEPAGAPDLAVLAAVVDRQSADLSLYAQFLMTALAGALPADHVTVERESGWFGRTRDDATVVAVSVRLGDHVYRLACRKPSDRPSTTVAHVVGGIVLSTRTVPLEEWSHAVASGLAELARHNAAAAEALARTTGYRI